MFTAGFVEPRVFLGLARPGFAPRASAQSPGEAVQLQRRSLLEDQGFMAYRV